MTSSSKIIFSLAEPMPSADEIMSLTGSLTSVSDVQNSGYQLPTLLIFVNYQFTAANWSHLKK